MVTVSALRMAMNGDAGGLFDRIGAFLAAHRLSPEPAHYDLAYQVLSHPDSVLAQAVRRISDGGVRLSRHDIEALGCEAIGGAPITFSDAADIDAADDRQSTDALLARTQVQVERFADTVRAIQAETSGFGRDITASAAAIGSSGAAVAIDEITQMTSVMIERIHSAEVRLATAHREADDLRVALDEARGSARLDPLTDLANRRAFDEAYAALAPETRLVVAVCDIDHFKRVNDEFGHAVGDRVLKAIGQTLAEQCDDCLVARYGGEEFALLFAGVTIDAAGATLERARSAIAARRFRSRETDALLGSITISAGVAAGIAATDQETMLARADTALYRAKAAGRNRVLRAPESGA